MAEAPVAPSVVAPVEPVDPAALKAAALAQANAPGSSSAPNTPLTSVVKQALTDISAMFESPKDVHSSGKTPCAEDPVDAEQVPQGVELPLASGPAGDT